MTSVISTSSSSGSFYGTIFAGTAGGLSGTTASWMKDAITGIQNSQNSGGILGALQSSGDGSIGSFLSESSAAAGNFGAISQNSLSNSVQFYTQLAAQNQQQQQAEKLQQTLDAFSQSQNTVQLKNVLDPVIYLPDGTTIDTNSNIMTRPDGTQYDTVTGAKYVDPADVIQMANGAYLNTSTNILTMSDGTQIDTVTGLKVSTSA